jgi:hypothetical protein
LSFLQLERFLSFVLLLQEENAAKPEQDDRQDDAPDHNGRARQLKKTFA